MGYITKESGENGVLLHKTLLQICKNYVENIPSLQLTFARVIN